MWGRFQTAKPHKCLKVNIMMEATKEEMDNMFPATALAKKRENWEKKFDNKFKAKENGSKVIEEGLSSLWCEDIKHFIRNLL